MKNELKARSFVEDSLLLPLSEDVIEKSIQIRKIQKVKLADAIIAATAIMNNMTLLTRNEADFNKILGVEVFNPFNLT